MELVIGGAVLLLFLYVFFDIRPIHVLFFLIAVATVAIAYFVGMHAGLFAVVVLLGLPMCFFLPARIWIGPYSREARDTRIMNWGYWQAGGILASLMLLAGFSSLVFFYFTYEDVGPEYAIVLALVMIGFFLYCLFKGIMDSMGTTFLATLLVLVTGGVLATVCMAAFFYLKEPAQAEYEQFRAVYLLDVADQETAWPQ